MTRHVGISLGNRSRFFDGLGEYTQQLGLALAARAEALREQEDIRLHFHCVESLHGVFGNAVGYLPVQRSQEWRHRGPPMDVWHLLAQTIRYGPPQGLGRQLLTIHDLNFVYAKGGLSRLRHRWRLRSLLRRTDEVVTISEHVAGDVRRELRWHGPLSVVHNGVRDLSAAAREPVPALQGRRFLFHVSRMTPAKNVESLLAMMTLWPEMQLVLAGPDATRNAALQAQAAATGLNNVIVLTAISDAQKAWLYAECAGFVFPSLTEGFGLPPVEAMHFGKPVLLSDRTSLPEIGGTAAVYWHDFEAASMKAVAQQAIAGFGAAQAEAARARAAGFMWSAAAELYLGRYRHWLASPTAPG